MVLVQDLCRGLPKPPQPNGGRTRTPIADIIFACALKVYTTLSSRRFGTDLSDAHAKGFLRKKLHPVMVCAFLEGEYLTPVLHDLITRSSLPLKIVETTFAPDSTGFATSRFTRWFDVKYGGMRSGKDWVKAHGICGVKTNVVTAVEIHDKDAGDSPQFKPLVERTAAAGFTVREVPADKAYLSHDNLALVESVGGTAFIPFKVNSTSGEPGSLWEKMFHYYSLRREEFGMHYHQRSNAESTFSMVKAKFRDHVRSKTDVAMKNEVLCKFLCHNICCLIQSQVELGIEPVFWETRPVKTVEAEVVATAAPVAEAPVAPAVWLPAVVAMPVAAAGLMPEPDVMEEPAAAKARRVPRVCGGLTTPAERSCNTGGTAGVINRLARPCRLAYSPDGRGGRIPLEYARCPSTFAGLRDTLCTPKR